MAAHVLLATTVALSGTDPRVTIAPGVSMPLLNFGIQKDHTAAIKAGARGIDTALTYGNAQQVEVGKAMRESGVPRAELFVTTKIPCCPSPFTSLLCFNQSANATANVEHDLKELGLGYVDLLLVHWPCARIEDTVATYLALEPYVLSGVARAIGVSNFNASALAGLLPRVNIPPAVNQCGFSIAGHDETSSHWGRDDGTRSACVKNGVQYSAYSPLGGLTKGGTGRVLRDPTVAAIAAAHNRSTAQVALRWVTQNNVVAVTSSGELSHIESDLATFDFTLSDTEMATLAAIPP